MVMTKLKMMMIEHLCLSRVKLSILYCQGLPSLPKKHWYCPVIYRSCIIIYYNISFYIILYYNILIHIIIYCYKGQWKILVLCLLSGKQDKFFNEKVLIEKTFNELCAKQFKFYILKVTCFLWTQYTHWTLLQSSTSLRSSRSSRSSRSPESPPVSASSACWPVILARVLLYQLKTELLCKKHKTVHRTLKWNKNWGNHKMR